MGLLKYDPFASNVKTIRRVANAQAASNANAYSDRALVASLVNDFIDQLQSPPLVLTDAATVTWNANNSPNAVAVITLGGNRTMGTPTNLVNGQTLLLIMIQDATGRPSPAP